MHKPQKSLSNTHTHTHEGKPWCWLVLILLQGRGVSGQLLFRYLKKHSVGSEKNVGLVDPKHIQREREREELGKRERERWCSQERSERSKAREVFSVLHILRTERLSLAKREKHQNFIWGFEKDRERENWWENPKKKEDKESVLS